MPDSVHFLVKDSSTADIPPESDEPEEKRRREEKSATHALNDLLKAAQASATSGDRRPHPLLFKAFWPAIGTAELEKCDDTTLLQRLLKKQKELNQQAAALAASVGSAAGLSPASTTGHHFFSGPTTSATGTIICNVLGCHACMYLFFLYHNFGFSGDREM